MILPICPHWSTYLLDYCSEYVKMNYDWFNVPNVDYKLVFIDDTINNIIHKSNATFGRITKVYKKSNKNANNIQVNIKCYNKLSTLERILIEYVINGQSDLYILELLQSNNDKNYKSKCVQFIKGIENSIKKYGIGYIDWIKECNFYKILFECFSKLVNFKSENININLNDNNIDVELSYGPYNPQVIIS